MTSRDDFTPVEWALLAELPERVVASATTAQRDGDLGAVMELTAGLQALSAGAEDRLHNTLVQAVFTAYKRDGAGEERAFQLSERWIESLIPDTLERCRQVAAVLAAKADPGEAADFAAWLIEVAEQIVSASRTGGFLGLGGQRVTEAESAFLASLQEAFASADDFGSHQV